MYREKCDNNPRVVIANVSLSFSFNGETLSETRKGMLPHLEASVETLNRAGVDFIVIPANTPHLFIEELRRRSKVKILSIMKRPQLR